MKEYTIYFKNGLQKVVSEYFANSIKGRIIHGNPEKFLFCSNRDGELGVIVNIEEIVFVEELNK